MEPTTETLPTAGKKIEVIMLRILSNLRKNDQDLEIILRTRPTQSQIAYCRNSRCGIEHVHTRRLCFPGSNPDEAWRFTVVVRILELIYEALCNQVILSKRDVYYRDPALFGSQACVDKYVDDIALTLGVPRSCLNVTAAAKGLIVGAVRFTRRDGSFLNAANDREGLLVPSVHELLSVDVSLASSIIVVEKEATFRSIAASKFWPKIESHGILITGKGYPDVATRSLLHFIATASPHNGFAAPPILALTDFDPDGLAIYSTYKHGSAALAHEGAKLCSPQLRWLGVHIDNVLSRADIDARVEQSLMPLSRRDRTKAIHMLAQTNDTIVAQALRIMIMLNIKAELQLLEALPEDQMMEDLLLSKCL